MDPRFQTSFIPKKPVTAPVRGKASEPVSLLTVISTSIFIAAIALTGAAFGYEKILSQDIEENKATLEQAKAAFDPDLIEQIIRLDNRIDSASELLGQHVAVSNLFRLLEENTLKTVRFTSFSFDFLGGDKVTIDMDGEAAGFTSIALQSDKFNSNPIFKNTILEDLKLEETGMVSFNVVTSVDPTSIMYRQLFQEAEASVPNASESSPEAVEEIAEELDEVMESLEAEEAVISEEILPPTDGSSQGI